MIERKPAAVALAVGLVAVSAVLIIVQTGDTGSLSDALGDSGIEMISNDSYEISSLEREKVSGVESISIEAESEEVFVMAELFSGVDRGFADSYRQEYREKLAALYTDKPAPYEGLPRREINCEEDLMPEEVNFSVSGTNYRMYADGEGNIGACSDQEVEYRVTSSILYCEEAETLVEFSYFSPVENRTEAPRLACG